MPKDLIWLGRTILKIFYSILGHMYRQCGNINQFRKKNSNTERKATEQGKGLEAIVTTKLATTTPM